MEHLLERERDVSPEHNEDGASLLQGVAFAMRVRGRLCAEKGAIGLHLGRRMSPGETHFPDK